MAWKRNENIEEMYSLYLKGDSLKQVGDAYGVTRQSVWELFNRNGFATRKNREHLPYIMF